MATKVLQKYEMDGGKLLEEIVYQEGFLFVFKVDNGWSVGHSKTGRSFCNYTIWSQKRHALKFAIDVQESDLELNFDKPEDFVKLNNPENISFVLHDCLDKNNEHII